MARQQEALFAPQAAAFTHAPSDKLVKRAEAVQKSSKLIQRFGGYFLRASLRAENKAVKTALGIAAAVEILAELPVTIAPLSAYKSLQTRRFNEAIVREYPHVENPRWFPRSGRAMLAGGTVNSYVDAVLAPTDYPVVVLESGGLPPDAGGPGAPLELAPVYPVTAQQPSNNFNALVEHP
jgi:hypothetical protein